MEQRQKNRHETSESWLRAATNDLRSYYADRGLTLPEKIRFSIAFTSHGKPPRDATAETARWPAECWPAAATDDGFCEIIIRADFADPLEILGILAHELVHASLPDAKHGKEFRDAALRIGLEGAMRRAMPGPVLRERLNKLAEALGPLPRARLNFDRVTLGGMAVADRPRKQTTRLLKAECLGPGCGYTVRLAARWIVDCGPPHCPKHGAMQTPPVATAGRRGRARYPGHGSSGVDHASAAFGGMRLHLVCVFAGVSRSSCTTTRPARTRRRFIATAPRSSRACCSPRSCCCP